MVTDVLVANKFYQLQKSAYDRGIHFDLSIGKVRQLLKKKTCAFTGLPFTMDGLSGRSIDRLDNTKGYVDGNVVACMAGVNSFKSSFDLKTLAKIVQNLHKYESKTKRNS